MKFVKCKGYDYGIGLGEYYKCYKFFHGHSTYDKEKYVLCLWPSECREIGFMEFDIEQMIDLEMSWQYLPEEDEKNEME